LTESGALKMKKKSKQDIKTTSNIDSVSATSFMKKKTKPEKNLVCVLSLPLVTILFLKILLIILCEITNSPLIILLDMNTPLILLTLVYLCAVFLIIRYDGSMKNTVREFLSDICDGIRKYLCKLRKHFFKYFGKLIYYSIILLVLFLQNKFTPIEINGKHPFLLQYNYALLCDAISGKTDTMTLDATDFSFLHCSFNSIKKRGRRSSTLSYACFAGNKVYLYENTISNYIDICQKSHKQLEIEYYKNSRIIKTIDGIRLYDKRTFDQSADDLKLICNSFLYSEGKNYEEIVQQLKTRGLENPYNIVYISTEYYGIGEIAMCDIPRNKIYVVRGNEKEDMLRVPDLPRRSTLAEITQILDNAGIAWSCSCCGNDTYDCFGIGDKEKILDHSKDTLRFSLYPAAGTPIPKDYVLDFSVDHVE